MTKIGLKNLLAKIKSLLDKKPDRDEMKAHIASTAGYVNKNLFDFQGWKSVLVEPRRGTIETFENGFKLTATGGDCFTLPDDIETHSGTFRIPVEPSTTYVLTWNIENPANDDGNVYVFFNGHRGNDTSDPYRCKNANNKYCKFKFTTYSNTTFIVVRFGVALPEHSITYSNIMLRRAEIGDDTFEPYVNNLQTQLTAIENKKASFIKIGENLSTFTFTNLKSLDDDRFHYGIIIGGGTDPHPEAMKAYLIFIGTSSYEKQVQFFPLYEGDTRYSFTGQVSGTTLTITAGGTVFGGLRLIWLE